MAHAQGVLEDGGEEDAEVLEAAHLRDVQQFHQIVTPSMLGQSPSGREEPLVEFVRQNQGGSSNSTDAIDNLRKQQREFASEKKRMTKQIRLEQRKRTRRMAHSAKLSTMDLVCVLEDRRTKAASRAAAKCKAKANAAAA